MTVINNLETAYLTLLKKMSRESQLEIIAALTSEPSTKKKSSKSVNYFSGKWKSENTADEIIAEIKNARNIGRNIENFD
jgi:hypothetical protein